MMGGVIARVKNDDKQFWNIEISCSQWEGSACTENALIFFLLSFGEGGRGEGFLFILHLFPTCSFQVPNMFHRFSMCWARVCAIAPHFSPICFAQSPPLLTNKAGPREDASIFPENLLCWEACMFQFTFVMGQSNWLIAKNK
jgi:hypothetical protein